MSIIIFLFSIVLANLTVAQFGPKVTPLVAFIFIGLDLSLRDKIHEKWHGKQLSLKMLALICAGAVITYILNRSAGRIGIASVIAFAAALLIDAIVYEFLWKKKRWKKMAWSNVFSSAVDSFLFMSIAFGAIMPFMILLQFSAKFFGGALWIWVLNRKKVEQKL